VKAVNFKEAPEADWNTLADNSPEAWIYHRTEWIGLQTLLFTNESFMIVSDDLEPLAIFVVYRSDSGHWWRFGTQVLFTGWGGGPAMVNGLSDKQRQSVVSFSLKHLRGRARQCRASHLEVRLPSLAAAYLPPARTEVNPLWEHGFSALPKLGSTLGLEKLKGIITPTVIIDLQGKNERQLFDGCSHACRNLVRKAMRGGVNCTQDDGPEGLDAFFANYASSHQRSETSGRPFDFFKRMHAALSKGDWMKIFLARHNGKTVASALLLSYKDGVTYAAGGVNDEGRRLSANNLLILETIKWALGEGKKWYETGLFFPYLQEDSKLGKIGDFKREFGGRDFNIFDGQFIYSWTRYLEQVLMEEIYLRRRRIWAHAEVIGRD